MLSSWIEEERINVNGIKYVLEIMIAALVFIVIWITASQERIKKMIQYIHNTITFT